MKLSVNTQTILDSKWAAVIRYNNDLTATQNRLGHSLSVARQEIKKLQTQVERLESVTNSKPITPEALESTRKPKHSVDSLPVEQKSLV